MEYDEVSLVTRPANQLSKVMLFKSDTSEEEMPTEEVEVVEAEATEEATEVAEETVEKGKKSKKMIPAMDEEEMDEEDEMEKKGGKRRMARMSKEDEVEIPAEVFDYIEALESANEELMSVVEKMQADIDAEAEAEEQEILKSADPRLVEIVKAAEERAIAAESIAKAERDYRLEREFVSKAQELNNLPVTAEEFGLVLKSVADALTEEQYDAIWKVLSAANANLANSAMFSEVGKSTASADTDSPMSVIEKAAARLQSEMPTLTKEQAIAKALEADANLYNQYLREGRKVNHGLQRFTTVQNFAHSRRRPVLQAVLFRKVGWVRQCSCLLRCN